MLLDIFNDITVRIKLKIVVIIQDIVIAKYLPVNNSSFFIGNVSSVSNVPLSFSPAIDS